MLNVIIIGPETSELFLQTKAYLEGLGLSYKCERVITDDVKVHVNGQEFTNLSLIDLEQELIKAYDAKSFESGCGIDRLDRECGDESDY